MNKTIREGQWYLYRKWLGPPVKVLRIAGSIARVRPPGGPAFDIEVKKFLEDYFPR